MSKTGCPKRLANDVHCSEQQNHQMASLGVSFGLRSCEIFKKFLRTMFRKRSYFVEGITKDYKTNETESVYLLSYEQQKHDIEMVTTYDCK